MAITLKRQLNDDEKKQILEQHGRNCFATGHHIPENEPLHFDHVRAFAEGGASEVHNIAPMCEMHNKAKGRLPLEDFRVRLRLEKFFSGGDTLTLKNLLSHLKNEKDIQGFGEHVMVKENGDKIRIETPTKQLDYDLYRSPATGWRYFYATLPVELLNSDDATDHKMGLQPRYLIFDKVFNMYRHFQRHPVLQPAIGRIEDGQLLLFDGQHKTAALLWNGQREFECKIYLSPDLRLLNDTNISAHDTFAQTRFYSSIMVLKLGSEFGTDFEVYKNIEDGAAKSEAGFMTYLTRERALSKKQVNDRFRSYLYNSVLEDKANGAAQLVSKGNRGTDEKPLTIDMLSKSIFPFMYREPVEDNMATDTYKRDREVANTVALMNMLHDLALSSWNSKAGPKDDNQRKLNRMFRSKAIMAWSELLKDAVCGKLDLYDADERARPFYRDLSQDDLNRVKAVVERLVNWNWWASPNDEIDRVLADNKKAVKDWFKDHGLTTGYLMGATE
jgi:tRNA splicing endonuclease